MRSPARARGFIALISAIIISVILMGLATTLGTSALFARMGTLGSESKRISLGLAESCTNVALLKAAQTYGYAGGETIPVGSNSCTIKPLAYVDDSAHHRKIAAITTQGVFNNSYSNVVTTAYVQDPTAPVALLSGPPYPADITIVSSLEVP